MLRKNLPLAVLAFCSFLIAGCSGGGSAGPTSVTSLTISNNVVNNALSFGSQTVSTSSSPTLVTLTNAGNTPITLSSVVVGGVNASDFALTGSCLTSITFPAGSSCTASLVFTPSGAGTRTATFTITDSVPGSPQVITLTGTATPVPAPSLTLSTLTAFSTAAGVTSPTQTLTLTNSGTAALTFTSIALGGTNAGLFAIANNTCGASLAVNASCAVTLAFTPALGGTFNAAVNITDNASGSPQSVPLTGTGLAPAVTFSPGPLTFVATNVGVASASQSVAVTNTGNAALTISNITITGTAASSYSQTNNCPASLAATTGNCTIYVTFTPTTTGSLTAAVSLTDNAPASPQSIALTGTGIAPAVTLTSSNLTFTSAPTVTSAAQSITLTNSGTSTLNISSITLGGTNASDFALTTSATPCVNGTTLAPAASCIISATFTPTAATGYSATITIADNALSSPSQIIMLNGTGTSTSSTYRTLLVIPETDNSVTPLYNLINSAKSTIDMTMYEMQDTTFLNDLLARCKAGVIVRVIFSSSVASSSKTAYTALNGQTNCSAVDSNSAFTNTHQKTITVDAATANATTAILSLNLQSQYYSTTRDFGIITNDAADIAAIETTFAEDYAAGGTKNTTEFNYVPGLGDDLVWSPFSTTDMLAIINNATTSLYIECEEFSAPNIISAIAAAATRGVNVIFICENEGGEYNTAFTTIKNAGANVWYYSSSTGFYVHAKAVVADLGLPTETVYMGSINYSTASLTANRELGVYITNNTNVSSPIAATIAATIVGDETGSGVTKY